MASTTHTKYADALLEAKYDTTLADFLNDHRGQGDSFDRIARDLHDFTNGLISVTGNTIRNWINDLQVSA